MNNAPRTLKSLSILFAALPARQKRSFIRLFPLSIISGFIDVLLILSVSRLFGSLAGVPNQPSLPFSELIPTDPLFKTLLLVIAFITISWLSSLSRFVIRTLQYRLSTQIWRELSLVCYNKILGQEYKYFLSKKTSDFVTSIQQANQVVKEKIIFPLLTASSGISSILFLSASILVVYKNLALTLLLILVVSYGIIIYLVTPYVRFASRQRMLLYEQTNDILLDSLRSIADIHLNGSENNFRNRFARRWNIATPFLWKSEILPEIPRMLIEPLGITIIFGIGLLPTLISQDKSRIVDVVPFISAVALACLKMIAPLQDCFIAYTSIKAGSNPLKKMLEIIDLPKNRLTLNSKGVSSPAGVFPRQTIRIKDLNFKYSNSDKFSLKNINVNIPVGSRIAFVGSTGSGKTTTAHHLLTLLTPDSGSIQLDGIDITETDVPAWRANCSYVPQIINLINGTIVDNVAYGQSLSEKNEDKVWEALEAAQLAEVVSELPMGIYSVLGENGIRLSGGQRQRIALARAFYRQSKLLVLDEATSSLDNLTESEVMNSIELIGRRCTLVIIAHRLSTVKRADSIYEFDNGEIKAFGTYEQLIEKSSTFKTLDYFE